MSKSNTKYLATISFAQGFCQVMARHYNKLPKRQNIKDMIVDLYDTCDKIIINHPEKINNKEKTQVENAVSVMSEHGLEDARSYQTYISFIVACVSERLEELSRCKNQSPKTAKLESILEKAMSMYEYFEIRTRNDEFDKDALKLLNNFNLLF